MGVKDLKKFLRNNDLVKSGNICQYAGKKVAIDISSYIYKYLMIFPDNWLSCFPSFISLFKECNVHPTFIFDGEAPVEKNKEKEKRKKTKNDIEEKVFNVGFDLENYKKNGVATDLLKDLMKKLKENDQSRSSLLLSNSENVDIPAIEEFIKKKEKQITPIKKCDVESLKQLLKLLGIPYIQSPVEAEAMCAYLYFKGEVEAVITEDTDILAYGVETFISNVNSKSGECEVIKLSNILKCFDMNMDSFLDFCVMCGTDYNKNIPKVGIQTSFKYIQEYKNIETILKEKGLDGDCLLKDRTRELFKSYGDMNKYPNVQEKAYYWEVKRNLMEAYRFMSEKRIRYSSETMDRLWSPPEITFED